jgi:lipooligosaccharide transport system ATP-binding protein
MVWHSGTVTDADAHTTLAGGLRMQDYVISARDIVKRYGDTLAVDGIGFHVKEGECYGLLGPNGAGKTTVLRALYNYTPLTAGSITILGMDIKADQRRIKRLMGVVPQEDNLDPDLTVFENLIVYARYFGLTRREARTRAEELLEFFRLADKKQSRIRQISGGMKRRLILARALLNQPRIVILDEPTTGLDPQARHLIWQRLRHLLP